MTKKNKSKLFYFAKHELVDKIIKMMSTENRMTESEFVEDMILSRYLPQNSQAKWIVEDYLIKDENGIKLALQAFFELAQSGVEVPDMLPFVGFAKRMELDGRAMLSGDEPQYEHLIMQVEAVIAYLESVWDKPRHAHDDIDAANQWLKELKDNPSMSIIFNFYNILIANWEALKSQMFTYRLLIDLIAITNNWRQSPEKKAQLLQLILQQDEFWDSKTFLT